jgi:hypothetical protein
MHTKDNGPSTVDHIHEIDNEKRLNVAKQTLNLKVTFSSNKDKLAHSKRMFDPVSASSFYAKATVPKQTL